MSYSIYYDRAFIRVNDRFIPLVNSGSNNCFEINIRGREVCEKDWSVLNWQRKGLLLFTADEIRDIAKMYDEYNQESGMIFKSRNRVFGAGEFERWIINGMKNAYTIEEYHSFGNSLIVLDYSASEAKDWSRHSFCTEDELLTILDGLKGKKSIDIMFSNNREVRRPTKSRGPRNKRRLSELNNYYVLGGECSRGTYKGRTIYLVSLSRSGFKFITEKSSALLKIFLTEKEARRYADKYADRFKYHVAFEPVHITGPAA